MNRNWQYYLLLLLSIEKVIQHIFVTYAFATNLSEIRNDVQFNYRYFMYSGILILLLFGYAGWLLLHDRYSGVSLMLIMGLVDFFGEFIGQGFPLSFIPVSFLLAIVIIIVSWQYRKSCIGDKNAMKV